MKNSEKEGKKGIELFKEFNAKKSWEKSLKGEFHKHTIFHNYDWIDYEVRFKGGGGIVCLSKEDRNELCEYLRSIGKKQTTPTYIEV